jgi:integrase
VHDDLIPKSPVLGSMPVAERPKVEGRADPEKIPTPEQVAALLDAMPNRYKAFVLLTAFCGLRSGKARGLRVGDLDPLHKTLTVRGQLVREKGGMSGGPEVWAATKTRSGARTIEVDAAVMAQLAEHIASYTSGGAGEFVLTSTTGVLLDANTMGNAFRRARARAGLPEWVTPHPLRHFAGSYALAAPGAQITDVQKFLGHSSPRVTADGYLHATDGAGRRVATGMGAAFALVSATAG